MLFNFFFALSMSGRSHSFSFHAEYKMHIQFYKTEIILFLLLLCQSNLNFSWLTFNDLCAGMEYAQHFWIQTLFFRKEGYGDGDGGIELFDHRKHKMLNRGWPPLLLQFGLPSEFNVYSVNTESRYCSRCNIAFLF